MPLGIELVERRRLVRADENLVDGGSAHVEESLYDGRDVVVCLADDGHGEVLFADD